MFESRFVDVDWHSKSYLIFSQFYPVPSVPVSMNLFPSHLVTIFSTSYYFSNFHVLKCEVIVPIVDQYYRSSVIIFIHHSVKWTCYWGVLRFYFLIGGLINKVFSLDKIVSLDCALRTSYSKFIPLIFFILGTSF